MPYGITGLERVKIYQYNPKHLYPKLNGYGDNGQRKVWTSVGSTHCTCQLTILSKAVLECGFILRRSACSRLHIHIYARSSVCKAVLITEVAVTYLLRVAKMPFVFSHVEYCDIHFVYGFCNGNALAAVEEYRRHFPDRRIPFRRVFTRIHQTLRDTGCMLLTYVLPSTLNRETATTPNTS